MLSSAIFKRGGPKKESGSVPLRPTDDPDVVIIAGLRYRKVLPATIEATTASPIDR